MLAERFALKANVVGQRRLATAQDNEHHELLVLVHESRLESLGGQVGAAQGDVTFLNSLQLLDRPRVERSLDAGFGA